MVLAELVDQCNLKCALCPTRFRYQSGKQMALSTVEYIVKKYTGRWMYWYNWGEPLLHKDFMRVADLIKGSQSRISTNLSLKLDYEHFKAMRKFEVVTVTLSGMTQEIYEMNHCGGNLDLVMKNIETLLSIRKNPRDTVINWLSHKYNEFQKPLIEEFCKKRDVVFNPCFMVCTIEELDEGFEHEFLVSPKFQSTGRDRCRIANWIPIDVDGDYTLCCSTQNVKVGYNVYNDVSESELIAARYRTDLCIRCREKELWRMFS